MTMIATAHSDADPATDHDDPARVLLTWRSHPMRRAGARRGWAIGAVIGIPLGLLILYGWFYALLAVAILGGSLASFFLPTRYVLYAGGLEARFLGVNRRFTWEQFRSFYPDKNGVLLSPFTRPSRLENFRGFYLRFDGCRDEIMQIVSERIRRPDGEEQSREL